MNMATERAAHVFASIKEWLIQVGASGNSGVHPRPAAKSSWIHPRLLHALCCATHRLFLPLHELKSYTYTHKHLQTSRDIQECVCVYARSKARESERKGGDLEGALFLYDIYLYMYIN